MCVTNVTELLSVCFVVIDINVFLSFRKISVKGRTIRKVMGGGREIFEPQEFFFVIKFLV